MNNVQNEVLTPANNTRDAWRRLTIEPLRNTDDPRYFDCSDARGTNVAGTLQDILDLYSRDEKCMHLLFTGYRGDGKTTELFQFMNLIKDGYRPLYFDAAEEFDLRDFEFPDFLLGIATAVFDRMKEQDLSLPNNLIKEIADWFASIVETIERKTSEELKSEIGGGIDFFKFVTARLVGTMKASSAQRQDVRKELRKDLTLLIGHVNKLLSKAVEVSKESDNKELVIIFDSLDRLNPELAYELFHTNGRNLCELKCHFIYVIPISLLYHPESPLLPFEPDNQIIMPMIPVLDKDGEANERNISDLKGLLEQRFIPDSIMTDPDNIMKDLILSSGGHLRDLVRLFRQTCRHALRQPDKKINPQIAQRAINDLCETYQKAVVEADYEHLTQTYNNKEAENNAQTQHLIYNNVILVYDENGVKWKDVHPALANGEKFQTLLQRG